LDSHYLIKRGKKSTATTYYIYARGPSDNEWGKEVDGGSPYTTKKAAMKALTSVRREYPDLVFTLFRETSVMEEVY